MHGIPFYALSALVFVLMISVLVAAHEYGHYIFARLFNMGVEEFAIGFGKNPLVTWMKRTYTVPLPPGYKLEQQALEANGPQPEVRKGLALEGGNLRVESEIVQGPHGPLLRESTNFTIRPWPIGGFVRIKGMVPEDDGSEVSIPGGFYSKPPWQRFIVLLAGPVFSLLAGIAILLPLYSLWGEWTRSNEIIGVGLKTAALTAGLKPGDRIVNIAGNSIRSGYDLVSVVRVSAGVPLKVDYIRAGQTYSAIITPELSDKAIPWLDSDLMPTGRTVRQGQLGVEMGNKLQRLPLKEAFISVVKLPYATVRGLLISLTSAKQFKENMGGPATIAYVTGGAVSQGLDSVLQLAALLSISVGIFNLLPFYPLDGGQMMMAVVEMVQGGRRLSIRVQQGFMTVGLGMMGALILAVLVADFSRFTTKPPKTETVHATTQKK